MINKTDKRILKLWRNGNHSLSSIARKIGRPGSEGMERVKKVLIENYLLEENE